MKMGVLINIANNLQLNFSRFVFQLLVNYFLPLFIHYKEHKLFFIGPRPIFGIILYKYKTCTTLKVLSNQFQSFVAAECQSPLLEMLYMVIVSYDVDKSSILNSERVMY